VLKRYLAALVGLLLWTGPAQALWVPAQSVPGEGKLSGHKHEIFSVAFSPDGNYLASGSFDGTTRIWETKNWSLLHELAGHANWISAVAFSPDGRWLATAGLDRRVQIWDLITGANLFSSMEHTKGVLSLVFSPDGKQLASGGLDGRILIHQLSDWKNLKTLAPQSGGIAALTYSPDGKYLVSSAYDDTAIRMWDALSGEAGPVLPGHLKEVYALSFSPDGKYLASAGEDRMIRLWDMHEKKTISKFAGHSQPIWTLAFSPDGRFLSSGSLGDQSLRFWTVPQGVNTQSLYGIPAKTYALSFNPVQPLLASGHNDPDIRIWENIQPGSAPAMGSASARAIANWFNPALSLRLVGIDDDAKDNSNGNHNHRIEPGELIEIVLALENEGTSPLKNLKIDLKLNSEQALFQGESTAYQLEELAMGEQVPLVLPVFIPKKFADKVLNIQVSMQAANLSKPILQNLSIDLTLAYPLPEVKGEKP